MQYRKFIYFLIVSIFFSSTISGNRVPAKLKYDSVIVKTQKPSAVQEQEVFKKVDLGFAKTKESADIGAWERFLNWLAKLFFGKSGYEDRATMQTIFIWIFVVLGLILAIWLFSRSEFSAFLRGNVKTAEFNFEDIDEDISGIDFNKRIEHAKAEHDFRLAIRWLYLRQLFFLNEKAQISWQPYKTNMDYMNELSKSDFKTAFKDISKVYEYVWYGKYSITPTDFKAFEVQFRKFENEIGV